LSRHRPWEPAECRDNQMAAEDVVNPGVGIIRPVIHASNGQPTSTADDRPWSKPSGMSTGREPQVPLRQLAGEYSVRCTGRAARTTAAVPHDPLAINCVIDRWPPDPLGDGPSPASAGTQAISSRHRRFGTRPPAHWPRSNAHYVGGPPPRSARAAPVLRDHPKVGGVYLLVRLSLGPPPPHDAARTGSQPNPPR
jgi:hypothetical protein